MLAGSLTEFSIPDIFSLLAATRKTGVLNLTGAEANGRVWIIGGALAYAVADMTRTPLAARLLHGGEIDTDTVEPLVRAQASEEGTQVSEVLGSAGIPLDRVQQLLHDQIVDAVFDLSRWSDGTFAFDADAQGAQGNAPVIAATEVLEAVGARIAEWDGIVAQLPSPASVLAPVSRPPLQAGGMVQMSPAQWEVFTLVDGLRTVSDIIAMTGQGQFVVARLLASLVADGILAVADGAGEQTLSQQRAAHLARLEQQLLGAAAPRGGADLNGRADLAVHDVDAPANGINGNHADAPPTDRADDRVEDVIAEGEDLAAGGDHAPEDTAAQDTSAHEAPVAHDTAAHGDDLAAADAGHEDPSAATDDETAAGDVDLTTVEQPQRDAAEERRAREMAALGIGPAEDSESDPTADAPQSETKSLGTDLLARLIDGVKGA